MIINTYNVVRDNADVIFALILYLRLLRTESHIASSGGSRSKTWPSCPTLIPPTYVK